MEKNNRNCTGAGTFFVFFCFLRCKQKGSHPAAKHYTRYSNTVLFLLIVWKWFYRRAYTQTSCIVVVAKVPQKLASALLSLPRAEQSEPACCHAAVWLLAASRHSGFRCFGCAMSVCAAFFQCFPERRRNPAGRKSSLTSPSRQLSLDSSLCCSYLWLLPVGWPLSLLHSFKSPTAAGLTAQRRPTSNPPHRPSLIHTSSQLYLLSVLSIDGTIRATSIQEHGGTWSGLKI